MNEESDVLTVEEGEIKDYVYTDTDGRYTKLMHIKAPAFVQAKVEIPCTVNKFVEHLKNGLTITNQCTELEAEVRRLKSRI